MRKNLTYFLSICVTMSILVTFWLTRGFRDFGAAEGHPLMPFFWGTVLFAAVFEPVLFSDFLEKKLKDRSVLSLFLRGIISGAIVFGVWACLYFVGLKYNGYEWSLIIVGYACAVGVGILGIVMGENRQNPCNCHRRP